MRSSFDMFMIPPSASSVTLSASAREVEPCVADFQGEEKNGSFACVKAFDELGSFVPGRIALKEKIIPKFGVDFQTVFLLEWR